MAQSTMGLFDPAAFVDAVEREACARRAALAALKYRNVWQAMARAMARRPKLRLEFSSRFSATDGDTIYLQVPIALGMDLQHDLTLCGLRDELLVQRCSACAAHEEVFITIIHEVAHLVHGTFQKMTEHQKTTAVKQGLKMECKDRSDGSRAAKIQKKIESAPERLQEQFMGLSGMISPFLPLVINAVEDSRVNLATEKTRKGTRTMFAASHAKILQRGIQTKDDQFRYLSESPPNMQALQAIFLMTSGIPHERWLDPEIVQRLDDPILKDLCEQAKTVRTIADVYALSVPILERLRDLGFCLSPEDEQDDPEPESGDEEQDQEEGGESGEGEPCDDGQESSDTGQDSSGSGSSDASGSDTPDDDDGPETGDKVNDLDGETAKEDNDDNAGQESGGDDGEESQEDGSDDGSSGESGGDPDADGDDPSDGDGTGDDARESDGTSDGDAAGSQPGTSSQDSDATDAESQGDASGDSGRDPSQPHPSSDNGTGEGGPGSKGDYVGPGDYYSPEQYEQDGTAEEVAEMMEAVNGHDNFGDTEDEADKKEPGYSRNLTPEQEVIDAIEKALNQALHFDHFSNELAGLNVWHYGDPQGNMAWDRSSANTEPTPENVLSPALMRLRLAFTDNRRAGKMTGLKKGRVNSKALARVPTGEDRVFQKRLIPTKKDYFVVVGFDISGSTSGRKINLIKGAVRAQAELLNRLGVKFAIYAHSSGGDHVDLFEVKAPHEPWGPTALKALDEIDCFGYNLDGHSLEFYRKVAQRRQETDKVVLFYTDGALNDIGEEYEVFTENVRIMRQKRITCVGVEVGVNSGMTERLGMDTVRIDGSEDIHKVVAALEKYIG